VVVEQVLLGVPQEYLPLVVMEPHLLFQELAHPMREAAAVDFSKADQAEPAELVVAEPEEMQGLRQRQVPPIQAEAAEALVLEHLVARLVQAALASSS
jgi:hypothetical protein